MAHSYVFKCPHCEKNLYKSKFFVYTIGNPIRTCEYCSKDYNHPYTYEWSILSIFHKFFYCFFANARVCFLLIALGASIGNTKKHFITWLFVWISISVLRLIVFDFKKIKESYERTKNNPEYIQKLSDLGCTNIAIRIDPYYK